MARVLFAYRTRNLHSRFYERNCPRLCASSQELPRQVCGQTASQMQLPLHLWARQAAPTSNRVCPLLPRGPRPSGAQQSNPERRGSHARSWKDHLTTTRWFTPPIPTGCIGSRSRSLYIYTSDFIYILRTFTSVSACVGETATQQDNVLLEGHTFAKNHRLVGPPPLRTSGVPRWDSGEPHKLHFTDWPLDRVSESGCQASCERNGDLSKEFVS